MLVLLLADPELHIGAVFVVPFSHVCRILDQLDAVLLTLAVRLAGIPEPEVQNHTQKGDQGYNSVTLVLGTQLLGCRNEIISFLINDYSVHLKPASNTTLRFEIISLL